MLIYLLPRHRATWAFVVGINLGPWELFCFLKTQKLFVPFKAQAGSKGVEEAFFLVKLLGPGVSTGGAGPFRSS